MDVVAIVVKTVCFFFRMCALFAKTLFCLTSQTFSNLLLSIATVTESMECNLNQGEMSRNIFSTSNPGKDVARKKKV